MENEHPEYIANIDRWKFTRDHYTGAVLDEANNLASNLDGGYLVRKGQSETEESFKERVRLADYTTHFSTVVDSLAGMLFAVEKEAVRKWDAEDGDSLGSPDDSTSIAARLKDDADGEGNGWVTKWKQLAVELIHSRRAWILVDSIGGEEGVSRIRILNPSVVTNWRYRGGILVDVTLKESVDARSDYKSKPTQENRYVHFTVEGWKRYSIDKDSGVETMLDEGTYQYVDKGGVSILPIFPVELPLPRPVGWLLARKANAIFNRESERDHLIRTCNFPYLVIVGKDTVYKAIVAAIKTGSRILQQDPTSPGTHKFIAPNSGPAKVATDVLIRKVEEFYVTGFREYGDAARERTATEVRQDVSSGVGAFLQMLKAAIDDAENAAFYRVEQTEFVGQAGKWGNAHVERTEDFLPVDIQSVMDRTAKRYFGESPVPVGPSGVRAVIRKLADLDGLTITDAEVEAAAGLHALEQISGLLSSLPLPVELIAEQTVTILTGIGWIDPEAQYVKEDGSKGLVADKIRVEIIALAEEKANERRAASAAFGGGGF